MAKHQESEAEMMFAIFVHGLREVSVSDEPCVSKEDVADFIHNRNRNFEVPLHIIGCRRCFARTYTTDVTEEDRDIALFVRDLREFPPAGSCFSAEDVFRYIFCETRDVRIPLHIAKCRRCFPEYSPGNRCIMFQ